MIILIALSEFPFLDWISSWVALALGILLAVFFGNPYPEKLAKITKNLLKISVVAIGFGYPITAISKLPSSSFYFVIIFLAFALFLGFIIGKILKVNRKTADLITSGTSICGASAIAAVASSIKANEKNLSVALGTVFIFSASSLLIFPLVGDYYNLSPRQFGLWAGLSIHDTASAIGAAIDYDEILKGKISEEHATIIKLSKVIFIVPLVFLASFLYKEDNKSFAFPYFILFFLLAMFLNSQFSENYNLFYTLQLVGKKGLQISLFLIGVCLSFKNLKAIGFRPFLHGFLLWIIVSIASLLAIKYLPFGI